jgi:hypothetical protein
MVADSTPPAPTPMVANALGSATAGIVGRICTHPLDTAKARLQAIYPSSSTASYQGVRHVLTQTFRTEGIRGLYRGFGAVMVGGTPGTVLYLCTYEKAKEVLSSSNSQDTTDFVVHFGSGLFAETIACIIYVPVDVIKERMQVQRADSSLIYRNAWDAVRQISKTEGLAGIYRGYAATLASFGPFSALYFVFYEKLKHLARQQTTGQHLSSWELDKVQLSFGWVVGCSASAGAVASWLTSPLDLAKLRLQVSRANQMDAGAPTYRGVVDCLQQAYSSGGVRGLFRGAGARVVHFAPATTITMTCYETCREMVGKLL